MKTTRLSRGSSTEMSLRLCSRAPRTTRWSCWGRGAAEGRGVGTAVTRLMLSAPTDRRRIAAYGGRHGDPDRGLRRARRHGDGRPRQPSGIHRLAVPAPLRLPRLFRRPPGHAGERPVAHRPRRPGADHPALPRELVRPRDRARDRQRRREGDRSHAAARWPGRRHPAGGGASGHGPHAARVGRAVQLRPDQARGCRARTVPPTGPSSSPPSPDRTWWSCRGTRLPHAEDGHHRDEFDIAAGEQHTFSTTWCPSYNPVPPPHDVDARIAETLRASNAWAARCDYDGPLPRRRRPLPAHPAADDRLADRRDRGGAHHQPAGELRRRAQLGLPLLLAP